MGLDYTIWFDDGDPSDYRWSLATAEATGREPFSGMPDMYAPLNPDGNGPCAFTLMKKNHPVVSEAKRMHEPVKILGMNRQPDLLPNIVRKPLFENRTIIETFVLLGQNATDGDYYVGTPNEWAGLVSEFVGWLNGHIGDMRIVLSHDPGFYWKGSVSAQIQDLEKYRAIITVTADVEPFKYERYGSDEPWMWDDFSFTDGVIREDYGYVELENGSFVSYGVPVRYADIKPSFHRDNDYTTDLEDDVIDLSGIVDDAIDNWGASTGTTIKAKFDDVTEDAEALWALYNNIQPADWNDIQSRINNIITALIDDIANERTDDVTFDLASLKTAVETLRWLAISYAVIASVDGGLTWYGVGFYDDEAHDKVVLRGAWDKDAFAHYQDIVTRSLFLKGVAPVYISIRGATL